MVHRPRLRRILVSTTIGNTGGLWQMLDGELVSAGDTADIWNEAIGFRGGFTNIETRMPPCFPQRGHGNRGMKGLPWLGLL